MPGARVKWEAGAGRVSHTETEADERGIARVQWVMPASPSTSTTRAVLVADSSAVVVFWGAAVGQSRIALSGTTPWFTVGPLDPRYVLRSVGRVRGLMVFVEYPDRPPRYQPQSITRDMAEYAEWWWRQVSRGDLDLDIVPVGTWRVLPHPYESYVFGPASQYFDVRRWMEDIVAVFDADVDFSTYDFVYVVPSFSWTGPFIATPGTGIKADGIEIRFAVPYGYLPNSLETARGVLVHEMSHLFGLPDLTQLGPTSIALTQYQDGYVGRFDVMGNPKGSGLLLWQRWNLGWIERERLLAFTNGGVETWLSPSGPPAGFEGIVVLTGSSTAIVVEARGAGPLDATLCESGVLVYEVDTRRMSGAGPLRVLKPPRGPDLSLIDRCGSVQDATLDQAPGRRTSYRDPSLGFSVDVLEKTPDFRYRVRVSFTPGP